LLISSKEEKEAFKIGTKNTLINPTRIHNSTCRENKSIFVHDIIIRRKLWLSKGISPVVTATG
jgi:hypothetical protein